MSRQIRLAGLSFIGLMIALVLSLVTLGGVASAQTCDTSGTKDGSASPSAVTQAGQAVSFTATGFKAGENVSFWFTAPGGAVAGTARPLCCAGADGVVRFAPEPLPAEIFVVPGKWALTVEGAESGHQSVIYFCVGAASAPPPAQQPPAAPTATSAPAAPPAAPPAAAPPAAPPEAAPSAPTESSPTTEVLPATSAESVGMPRTGEGDNAMLVLLLTGILGMSLLGSGWLVNRKYNVR